MNDYAKYIQNLAQNDESIIFQNSSSEHASIVMSTIFKYSNENIRILAGNLNGEVSSSENYNKELQSFLNRNGKIRILLDDYNKNINPQTLKILSEAYYYNPELVEIRLSPIKIIGAKTKKNLHFCIGDKKMFRLELDTKKYIANCSLNSVEISGLLIDSFDMLFENNKSTPLAIDTLQ